MKRNFLFIALIIGLIMVIGCSKESDADNNNSSPTEIDFTNNEWVNDLDYLLYMRTDYLELMVKDSINFCELIINDLEIDTEEWEYHDYFPELPWSCQPYNAPEELDISPGSQVNISLTINGENFTQTITMPYSLEADFPEFDISNDYAFSWEITENALSQMAIFRCGNSDDNDISEYFQLNPSDRNYIIQQSIYSDFVETGYDWFAILITAINYQDFENCVFYLAEEDIYDDGRMLKLDLEEETGMLHYFLKNR